MTPYDGTQAKVTGYEFVANNRQNQRQKLRPEIFIQYMLILP
jgi:hypothetical protein